MVKTLLDRVRAAFTRALAAALAAAFAFWVAHRWLGHPQPVFAAISALICLAPGIPSHVRQGLGLMVGVTIGILVGRSRSLSRMMSLKSGWPRRPSSP